jgi:hypothetical protein
MRGGSPDGIDRTSQGMRGNVGCCNGLARSMGSGDRILVLRVAGCSVGIERGFAYVRHPEYSGLCPSPARFYGVPGPVVMRAVLLKIQKDMFSAIRSPERQYLLIRNKDLVIDPFGERPVKNFRYRPPDIVQHSTRPDLFPSVPAHTNHE